MMTHIDIEPAARSLAEARVPGSTRPGGHYHLSEAWRSMLRRQARADLAQPDTMPLAYRAVADRPQPTRANLTGRGVVPAA